MFQLIKQVLKSFKKSALLLIGLVFISFAIIFASFSSLYFSNNISYSYNSLKSESGGNDAISELGDSNLVNSTLSYNLDYMNGSSYNVKAKSTNGNYYTSLSDYANDNSTFVYSPTKLSHSSFIKNTSSSIKNFIFAYYSNASTNPYFQGTGVNDATTLYSNRARGILTSYGNLIIPSDKTQWRAYGVELGDSDLQYVIYEIDPLTGTTKTANNGMVNTVGYFNGGYVNRSINLNSGNILYPTSLASDQNSTSQRKPYMMKNGSTETPFFIGKDIYSTSSTDFESSSGSIQDIFKKFQTVSGTDDSPDISNILASFYAEASVSLTLDKDVNWDIASFSPFYDYLKILRDSKYLTTSETGNPVTQQNDFVFRIHLNMENLTDLQKETLDYLKSTDLEKYIDLTSFIYTVNGSWIKSQIQTNLKSDSNSSAADNATFNNLEDLSKSYGSSGITGNDIIKTWLTNYTTKKLTSVTSELNELEKEYLSTQKLSQMSNIDYKIQKSYSISDSKTSSSFIVSQKGTNLTSSTSYYGDSSQNNNVDKLVLSSGSDIVNGYSFLGHKYNFLANSAKDQDIKNALLQTHQYNGSIPNSSSVPYAINTGGFLTNLVEFLYNSDLSKVSASDTSSSTDSKFLSIKEIASKLLTSLHNQIQNSETINANDYYHLFSLITPDLLSATSGTSENITDNLFTFNNQNIDLLISIKGGFSPSSYSLQISLVSPYGNAAVVNDKWLIANNKKVLSQSEWYNALKMSSEDFNTWKKSLSSDYKVTINSVSFIIIGTGSSFENSFPIVSEESPIPNPNINGVAYVDDVGYKSILATNSAATQDIYFAIKFKNKVDIPSLASSLNKYLSSTYSSSDSTNLSNLLTARISYPKIMNIYIQLFMILLVAILIVIGIYLSYLLIKIYVEKNQISLAISKANGISSLKISVALSTFGLFAALISGLVGYVLAYFGQGMFLGVLDNYWFIPIIEHNFSAIGLIGGIVGIYGAFFLFVILGVWLTFKRPINDLLSSSSELKVNKLLYLLKSRKIPIMSLTKFRMSLAVSKLTRFVLFIILCSAGLSIIAVGTSIPSKFATSEQGSLNNKQYSYRYDLQTPTEQSGLYKTQDYKDLGITDANSGIYSIYDNSMMTFSNNPYRDLWNNESNKSLFALRTYDSTTGQWTASTTKYFGNLLLPSYSAINLLQNDIGFFRNAVVTKWLTDFDISVAGIYVNAWSYLSSAFPSDLISRINALNNNFLSDVLAVPELKTINDKYSYIIKNSDGDYVLNSSSVLDLSKVIDVNSVRFTDSFLEFIGMIYGNETLAEADAKISFGIIPFIDKNSDNLNEKYTYLNTVLNDKSVRIPSLRNDGKKTLTDISQEIIGIKNNSQYVTLVDKDGKSLNSLLQTPEETKNGYTVYPLVINQGAAYKYNLKVGNTFKVDVNNTYDRDTKKMVGVDPTKTVMFKVVGINSDAFDVSMYTSQTYANEILGLNFNQGAVIISSAKVSEEGQMTSYIIGDKDELYQNSATGIDTNVSVTDISTVSELNDYVPFNGIFSKESSPLLLRSLQLTRTSGLWGNFTSFTNDGFKQFVTSSGPIPIYNSILPYSNSGVEIIKKYLNLTDGSLKRVDVVNNWMKKDNTTYFYQQLQNTFGSDSQVAIGSFEYFKNVFDVYVTIFNTLLTVETLLICLFVPLIIIIIMIISSVMMNDFRKMIAILKTLGYSDRENLFSILLTFIPVVIISLIIGLIALSALSTFCNFFVFNVASIYLSPSIEWLSFLYGVIAVVGIIIINFIFVSIYLKKQNLKNSITN